MGDLDELLPPLSEEESGKAGGGLKLAGVQAGESFERKREPQGVPGLSQDAPGSHESLQVLDPRWAVSTTLCRPGSVQGLSIPHSSLCSSPKGPLL